MSDTSVAATFTYRHEAEFARETLREAGIESVLAGDDAGGAHAGLGFTRPFRLLVRLDELDQAKALLESGDAEPEGPDAA